MKKLLLTLGLVFMTMTSVFAQSNLNPSLIRHWLGTGANEAILVVNWYNEAIVAWGFRWDDPNDDFMVADMLEYFDDNLADFSCDGYSSGFINEFEYSNSCLNLSNLAGNNSDETGYWMYAVNNVMAPMGVSGQHLLDGDVIYWEYQIDWSQWGVSLDPNAIVLFPVDLTTTATVNITDSVAFGNAYTANGFNIAANDILLGNNTFSRNSVHTACTQDTVYNLTLVAYNEYVAPTLDFADINWWVGSGSNEAMLILDFTFDNEAVAFGFRWNGNATVADMLQAYLDSCQGFAFPGVENGFITSISYNDSINGIYHNDADATVPGYWMYALNNGYADAVTTQALTDGDIVYFEYHTDMNNWDVIMPSDLAPVYPTRPVQTGLNYATNFDVTLSPVPAVDMLTVNADKEMANIEIVAANGMVVISESLNANNATINVSALSQGFYLLRATMTDGTRQAARFIKK